MTEPFAGAPWNTPDYRAERDRAMFAYAAYFDAKRIDVAVAAGHLGEHKMPENWIRDVDVKVPGQNNGLTAQAFVSDRFQKVIIAYRGQDDARDEGARKALNIDGDILGQLGLPGPKANTPKRQLADVQSAGARLVGIDAWDRQFDAALDYAKHVRDLYASRGYSIEVVGHDIGGSHAELAAQTFGWPGRTFDAHGAANVAQSDGYHAWLAKNGVKPVGIPGYDPDNLAADNFLNYQTRFHEPTLSTGPHLGQTRTVSALAGREGVKDHVTWLASTVDSALGELPLVGELGYRGVRTPGGIVKEALKGAVQHQTAQGVDTGTRGSMERLVRAFDIAVREGDLPTFGQDTPEREHGRTITSAGTAGPSSDRPDAARPASPRLADEPSHPDFATFDRIHAWVRDTGQWDADGSRNVSAALYCKQLRDPLVRRVDYVTGGIGRDGAHNVFAVHAPFGDQEPRFHTCVDGRLASAQPVQQALERAEQMHVSVTQSAPQHDMAMQPDHHRAPQRVL